eukprot:4023489-Pyramimonas_sp.AAC.1
MHRRCGAVLRPHLLGPHLGDRACPGTVKKRHGIRGRGPDLWGLRKNTTSRAWEEGWEGAAA